VTIFYGLGSTSYTSQVQSLAPSYGVPPSLAVALMNRESSGNPSAVSSAGAIGLFQLMPATAASLGVDPHDSTQNIEGGLSYLKSLYDQYGDWSTALIAYNEGPGNLANRGVFPSSQSYADSILAAAGDLGGSSGSDVTNTGDLSAAFQIPASLDLSSMTGLSWPLLGGIAAGIIVLGMAFRR